MVDVIWFLGYALHQPNVKYPSEIILNGFTDAGNILNQPQYETSDINTREE